MLFTKLTVAFTVVASAAFEVDHPLAIYVIPSLLEFASVGAVIVADVVLLYTVADFVVDVAALPFQYLYVAVISFLNIAYSVAPDAGAFKLLNAVLS